MESLQDNRKAFQVPLHAHTLYTFPEDPWLHYFFTGIDTVNSK